MTNTLPAILLLISVLAIGFYIALKFKTVKGFSFARTFPFEVSQRDGSFKVSIILVLIFAACSILFHFTIYTYYLTNSYILLTLISSLIICGLFFALNLINLVNLKVHFFAFSLFAALITIQSVIMGFHSVNSYMIDNSNGYCVALAVIFFIEAFFELILISPLFKFSFLMEIDTTNDTYKKPKFIRLAFYEWLYLLFFIINNFLLFVERSV